MSRFLNIQACRLKFHEDIAFVICVCEPCLLLINTIHSHFKRTVGSNS